MTTQSEAQDPEGLPLGVLVCLSQRGYASCCRSKPFCLLKYFGLCSYFLGTPDPSLTTLSRGWGLPDGPPTPECSWASQLPQLTLSWDE